jgi:hypothetical protein
MGGVKGHNQKDGSFPGSPGPWPGSFIPFPHLGQTSPMRRRGLGGWFRRTIRFKEEGEMASLIHRRRIWWEPVPEATGYGVYVSKDRTFLEPGHFSWEKTPGIISRMVTGKTELILPDEWPEFPTEPGTYHIGITSRDDLGNQSDPLLLSGPFKFLAPPAPSRGGVDYL